MNKTIIKILKSVGLYNFLLKQKRSFDRRQFEAMEKRNSVKRAPFYSQFLKKGDTVFDVGANVGNRVQVFLELGCKVIAVEPQKECISQLKNKFGSSIQIVEKGLGEKEEEKTIYISDTSTLSSLSKDWIDKVQQSRFSRHTWEKTEQIQLTTLDKLIDQFGIPQFCKIDVEGFELEVLKGLHQPIPCLSLEYAVPEHTERLIDCVRLCNQLSQEYRYNYSVGEEMKFELSTPLAFADFVTYLRSEKFQATGFGDIYIQKNQ